MTKKTLLNFVDKTGIDYKIVVDAAIKETDTKAASNDAIITIMDTLPKRRRKHPNVERLKLWCHQQVPARNQMLLTAQNPETFSKTAMAPYLTHSLTNPPTAVTTNSTRNSP